MNKRPSSKRRCSWVLGGPAGQRLCGAELPVGAAGPGPLGSDTCVRERRRPSRTGGAVGSWLRTNRMACRLPRSPAGSGRGRPWRSIALTWKVRPTPKEEQGAVGRAHSSRLPGSSLGPARTMRLPQAPRLRSRRKDYPATCVLALGEPRRGADRRGSGSHAAASPEDAKPAEVSPRPNTVGHLGPVVLGVQHRHSSNLQIDPPDKPFLIFRNVFPRRQPVLIQTSALHTPSSDG